MILYDKDLRVLEWNASAERMYGYTKTEITGQTLPTVPGQIATVLVAFAVTEFKPSQINAGNDTRVPPPATELIAPARNADRNATATCKRSNLRS